MPDNTAMRCARERLNRFRYRLGCGLGWAGESMCYIIGATCPIPLNRPCAAAVRPYVTLLWPLVIIGLHRSITYVWMWLAIVSESATVCVFCSATTCQWRKRHGRRFHGRVLDDELRGSSLRQSAADSSTDRRSTSSRCSVCLDPRRFDSFRRQSEGRSDRSIYSSPASIRPNRRICTISIYGGQNGTTVWLPVVDFHQMAPLYVTDFIFKIELTAAFRTKRHWSLPKIMQIGWTVLKTWADRQTVVSHCEGHVVKDINRLKRNDEFSVGLARKLPNFVTNSLSYAV